MIPGFQGTIPGFQGAIPVFLINKPEPCSAYKRQQVCLICYIILQFWWINFTDQSSMLASFKLREKQKFANFKIPHFYA